MELSVLVLQLLFPIANREIFPFFLIGPISSFFGDHAALVELDWDDDEEEPFAVTWRLTIRVVRVIRRGPSWTSKVVSVADT